MKYWNELDGSILFNKVFSTQVPIGIVRLFAITIDNNSPDVTLEFDIHELPDMPPEKWKKKRIQHMPHWYKHFKHKRPTH